MSDSGQDANSDYEANALFLLSLRFLLCSDVEDKEEKERRISGLTITWRSSGTSVNCVIRTTIPCLRDE